VLRNIQALCAAKGLRRKAVELRFKCGMKHIVNVRQDSGMEVPVHALDNESLLKQIKLRCNRNAFFRFITTLYLTS
jgi:hypothetical protein